VIQTAEHRLIEIIGEINRGVYVRPSQSARRLVKSRGPVKMSVREMISAYLDEKRRRRGKKTAAAYKSRLDRLLAFAEEAAIQKEWRFAAEVDREFATRFREYLFDARCTSNGRAGARTHPLSASQILNVLDATRSAFHWGRNTGCIPLDWITPFTDEVVGSRPAKDPLREQRLSLHDLINLVGGMDRWQLCSLGLMCVLPPRPDEFCSILVRDLDMDRGVIRFAPRFGGAASNKCDQTFVLPFPACLRPLLKRLIADRVDGPLFRRRCFSPAGLGKTVREQKELNAMWNEHLLLKGPKLVTSLQDRKAEFRVFLRQLGGVSVDVLRTEFQRLIKGRLSKTAKLYDLRHAVTQSMKDSGMPILELRYLTSHTASDIMNTYTTMKIFPAMERYFSSIAPLLNAISTRMIDTGVLETTSEDAAEQLIDWAPSIHTFA